MDKQRIEVKFDGHVIPSLLADLYEDFQATLEEGSQLSKEYVAGRPDTKGPEEVILITATAISGATLIMQTIGVSLQWRALRKEQSKETPAIIIKSDSEAIEIRDKRSHKGSEGQADQ